MLRLLPFGARPAATQLPDSSIPWTIPDSTPRLLDSSILDDLGYRILHRLIDSWFNENTVSWYCLLASTWFQDSSARRHLLVLSSPQYSELSKTQNCPKSLISLCRMLSHSLFGNSISKFRKEEDLEETAMTCVQGYPNIFDQRSGYFRGVIYAGGYTVITTWKQTEIAESVKERTGNIESERDRISVSQTLTPQTGRNHLTTDSAVTLLFRLLRLRSHPHSRSLTPLNICKIPRQWRSQGGVGGGG